MRPYFSSLLLLVVLVTSHPARAQAAATEKALFTEAQRAYAGGDLATARQKFESILELNPRNSQATNYLRTIKARQAQAGGPANTSYDAIIIPKINFRDATFDSTLKYMSQQVEAVTKGQATANFVPQLPPEQMSQTVSLTLQNVPFPIALKYLGEVARVRFSIEKYAITVKPLAPTATPPDPGPDAE